MLKHVACYQPDYPRPQLVRRQWTNLNGEWSFAETDSAKTVPYAHGFCSDQTIRIPFAVESPLSGIGNMKPRKFLWYCRKFRAEARKTCLLHIERSDCVTEVWINGEYAGHSETGYARFSCEVGEYLHEGENTLCIRVTDGLSREQVRGKQSWLDRSFSCFYRPTSGIYGSVWLEFLPETYVAHLKITPDLAAGGAKIVVTPNREVTGLCGEVLVSFNGEQVAKQELPLAFEPSTKLQEEQPVFFVQPSMLKLWSAEDPALYDVTVRLKLNGGIIDEVYSYFGMRSIATKDGKILLNGKPLYLKMVLDQGYWEDGHLTPPNEQALLSDLEYVHSAGFNGVRKHQKIEDERFYYYADLLGIYVWCELPSAYAFTDRSRANLVQTWASVLPQMYNHPSVICFVPVNESWGVWTVKDNFCEQSFVNAMYYLTKAYDGTRPVISNDGWEHTVSDILTIHVYEQDAQTLADGYRTIERATCGSRLQSRKPFAEGYSYRGQPIIFSEFGGTTILDDRENGKWGYGKAVKNREELGERITELIRAVKSLGYTSGYCYTQLSDVQQEVNGLLCADRSKKVERSVIKAANDLS